MQEALTKTLVPYWENPSLLKRLTGYSWWVEAVEDVYDINSPERY